MSIFSRMIRLFEGKSLSSLDLFRQVYGGRESNSGKVVNWQNSLDVATVLACVRVISNGVAQVPFRVYQDTGTGRKVATGHPLHRVLSLRPNGWQTSFSLRETIMFHVLLTGNAFVWKGMVGAKREIRALEPIEPGRVRVTKNPDGSLEYRVNADDGSYLDFSSDEIWHIRGPAWNGWLGMDATKMARDAIGLSMALEASHANFHKGGAQISGLLSVKDKISAEKFEFLSSWLDRHSENGDRAGKPIILDGDANFKSFNMSGVDSQHLETRKHQIEEICREFGVMPIMVGHADKTATYASAEQMFLAHVVHTLSPWYQRLEESANVNLLNYDDWTDGYYTKFTSNALMRGAAADRAAYYMAALGTTQQPGWMVQNEVRALEDMDPIEGGDKFPTLITGQDAPMAEDENNG